MQTFIQEIQQAKERENILHHLLCILFNFTVWNLSSEHIFIFLVRNLSAELILSKSNINEINNSVIH